MNQAYRPVLLVIVAVVGVVSYYGWQKAEASKERVPWRSDYVAARQEAQDAHKKLLVYFTASWCRPCQNMKTTTWNDSAVEHVLQDYVPVKLDVDRNRELAQKYNINGIPHFIVFAPSGENVKETQGAMYADEFVRWVKK